jgi:outer membrane protein OmpA-like peptidoglycan-associated protein
VKQALKLTLTPPSGPDYRLLGRMPSYAAGTPEKKAFDELGFAVRGEEEVTEVSVQGAKYVVAYRVAPGAAAASDAEIQENYRAALSALGAALLYTDPRTTVARLEQNGQTIWIRVYSQDGEIEVRAIEEKPFGATLQPPQAASLKSVLEKEGRVALYVGFDGAKAALKPEAAKTVAEIVKLLKENPTLKLSIEGHTDDVGPRPANEKLSRDRAAAVLDAIAAGGIARARLSSAGHGPAKPIADNGTSEGRAKNRRVELVKG